MSKQIVYASTKLENTEGRTVKNPRLFTKVVPGATKVYIDGNYPNIVKAYEDAGVSVSPVSEMRALPVKKESPKPSEEKNPVVPDTSPSTGS